MGDKVVIGGKGRLTDAGSRIPFIANCSGVTAVGKICDDLIDFTDFMPTLAELAGADFPEGVVINGRSIASQIYGRKGNPREWVYNQYEGEASICTKDWKLYRDGRLFDMQNDFDEKQPIFPSSDASASVEMCKKLEMYFEELLPESS